jgi:gluconate 2-dehydrogenase gamma chain
MFDMSDLDRRSMIGRMAMLLGVASLPVEAFAKAAPRSKKFLNVRRMRLLSAVADTMIPKTDTPGALDAKVPVKFDGLLANWASPERRVELLGALLKIDAAAMAQEKVGFAALTPAKRNALLSAHDAAALKGVPDTRKLKGMSAMMAGPSVADPAYAKLRELIIMLYFYSEEALTSVLTYEHVPGGWTPSVKVTPETRNTGGLGMF